MDEKGSKTKLLHLANRAIILSSVLLITAVIYDLAIDIEAGIFLIFTIPLIAAVWIDKNKKLTISGIILNLFTIAVIGFAGLLQSVSGTIGSGMTLPSLSGVGEGWDSFTFFSHSFYFISATLIFIALAIRAVVRFKK